MPQALTDDESTLVQVMAWCRQATSHYPNSVDEDLQRHMASLGPNELNLSIIQLLLHYNHKWKLFMQLLYFISILINISTTSVI